MKIVFMGTPDFAVGALEALVQAGHDILLVVTQPDRPKGRNSQPVFPPVKECALKYHLPVFQPERIKRPEAVEELKKYQADVFVVAAFGQILSQEILDMPNQGCLNIHASLLPKYRGASPIQHVIIEGENTTGITVQMMNAGIDTGDILYSREISIDDTDNYETLHNKLMVLGGECIVETLEAMKQEKLSRTPQDDSQSSYAPIIKKEMGELDFSKRSEEIDRLIRGLTPWPSAYTFYKGKQLKIWNVKPQQEDFIGAMPGEIVKVEKDCLVIACGKGSLIVYELQLEGKKRMSCHDFLLGVRVAPGEILGKWGSM